MNKIKLLFFLILFLLGSYNLAHAKKISWLEYTDYENINYPRTNFGNPNLHFWYPLTKTEKNVLLNKRQLINSNARALTELSIFSSGNARTFKQYKFYKRKITEFIYKTKYDIQDADNEYEKGKLLLSLMHKFFLSPNVSDSILSGYAGEQSRLTTLLDTGKYNCISSTILYIILARYFNMNVKGVMLPSHSFVQLILRNNNRKIEIETTSPDGYDWKHDRQFYQEQAEIWYKNRNLNLTTYTDYLNRKIIEPYQLIANNMINQHTAKGKMPAIDQRRLLEAHAYIDSDNPDAQIQIYNLYNEENNYLSNYLNDYKTIVKMYNIVSPNLNNIKKKFNANNTILSKHLWMLNQYAYSEIKLGNINSGLKIISQLFKDLKYNLPEFDSIRHNLSITINEIIFLSKSDSKFEEIENIINSYSKYFKKFKMVKLNIDWFYRNWSLFLVKKKLWEDAIYKLEKELKWISFFQKGKTNETKTAIGNIYGQWGTELNKQKKYLQAIEKFKQMIQWNQNPEYMETAYNLLINVYLNRSLEIQDYDYGNNKVFYYKNICNKYKWWATNLSWFYSQWAEKYWNEKKWDNVIQEYEQMLKYTVKKSEQNKIYNNLFNAYFNKSLDYRNNGNWNVVYKIFKDSLKRFPECKKCREELKNLQMRLSHKK